jgi:hypothetical protein
MASTTSPTRRLSHLAEGDHRQLVGLDLQDGEVGFRVAADDASPCRLRRR